MPGVSTYQIQSKNWTDKQCRELVKSLDKYDSAAIAVLFGSFGSSNKCLDKLINARQLKHTVIEFHFSNEVCRRNRNCSQFDLLPRTSVKRYNSILKSLVPSKVVAWASRLKRLTARYSAKADIIISTGLESNYSKESALTLIKFLGLYFEENRIAYNPAGRSYAGPVIGTLRESHGYSVKSSGFFLSNGDGEAFEINRVRAWARSCRSKICFLWQSKWQGLGGAWQYPYKRKFIFTSSDRKLINSIW